MTEERFEELINLYLDNEIGRSDLGELKRAIKSNLVRRRKFERACQLHQAARKALIAPAHGGGTEDRAEYGHRSSTGRKSSLGGPRDATADRQGEALRNASIASLAERQEKRGVASAVDLDKIHSGSRVGSRTRGGADSRKYGFFDSPAGMLVAFLLTVAGCMGMYFVLRANSPATKDDTSEFSATSSTGHLDGRDNPQAAEELAAAAKNQKEAPLAADDTRARLYQSALTGQDANNSATADYFSSHLDTTPASGTAGNGGAGATPPVEPDAAGNGTNSSGADSSPAPQP